MPQVSIVVPIFNGVSFLPAFFESLGSALPQGCQVVLVDDGSTEPVFGVVPEMPAAAEVIALRHDENLGYSATVNQGLAETTGEIVVQLNTDLVLDPRCIDAMVHLIQREKSVGIVGSKLVYPTNGRVQSVGMTFGDHSKRHFYRGLPADHPLCLPTREVQIVTGATVAMTRRVLNLLGPLDERYFNQNDDLDHCLRARSHGLRNFSCADSIAYHWRSQSGPSRYARTGASEARFWAKWAGRFDVDLGGYVDEALDHVLTAAPHLEDVTFDLVDLSRGADQPIVLERLDRRWAGLASRARPYRQMNNPEPHLWLPLLLPHWMASDPTPFVYFVDSHRDLTENVLWFEHRRDVVQEEIVVDLAATVVTTSEMFPDVGQPSEADVE